MPQQDTEQRGDGATNVPSPSKRAARRLPPLVDHDVGE